LDLLTRWKEMLIDTSSTVAYKCASCGTYAYFRISIFELLHKKQCRLTCRCKHTNIIISEEASNNYKVKIGCIGCGKEHSYIVSMKELLYKDTNVFSCPETGIQQCFIGKDADVRKKVDSLEKEMDELIDAFGYESYFKNTQVMFDSLNKIHDIAERKNLTCECGNEDIELILLSDRIQLKCKKCHADKVIYAASNEDLRGTLLINHILLQDSRQDKCNNAVKKSFLSDNHHNPTPAPTRKL
jgi:hypothetical protein